MSVMLGHQLVVRSQDDASLIAELIRKMYGNLSVPEALCLLYFAGVEFSSDDFSLVLSHNNLAAHQKLETFLIENMLLMRDERHGQSIIKPNETNCYQSTVKVGVKNPVLTRDY